MQRKQEALKRPVLGASLGPSGDYWISLGLAGGGRSHPRAFLSLFP